MQGGSVLSPSPPSARQAYASTFFHYTPPGGGLSSGFSSGLQHPDFLDPFCGNGHRISHSPSGTDTLQHLDFPRCIRNEIAGGSTFVYPMSQDITRHLPSL